MNRLLIFTRWPEAGRAKTRLIPALGPEGAARLSEQLTEHCLAFARRALARWPDQLELEVRFEGGDAPSMAQRFGADLTYVPQGPGDLGERLGRAAQAAWNDGVSGVLLVGSDCPEMTDDVLGAALEELAAGRCALGPASDGGYYLLGLRARRTEASVALETDVPARPFQGIDWSTERVADQTRDALRASHLSWTELPTLDDVDRPDDLVVWERRPLP